MRVDGALDGVGDAAGQQRRRCAELARLLKRHDFPLRRGDNRKRSGSDLRYELGVGVWYFQLQCFFWGGQFSSIEGPVKIKKVVWKYTYKKRGGGKIYHV